MPFSSKWLALREPADRAARSRRVTSALANRLPAARPLGVLDLGCGTGATLRAISDALPEPQDWLLIDHDPALLAEAAARVRIWIALPGHTSRLAYRVHTRAMDLNQLNASVFDRRALVTASALLDLVSEEWVRKLVTACREFRASVLFALTYDGRMTCTPEEPEDALVRDLVNHHQRTDKGLGPALGPDAADVTERVLREAGYEVIRDASDWRLKPDSGDLQKALIDGWAEAAVSISPEQASVISDWKHKRIAHVTEARSEITVGHQDVAGTL